MKTLLRTLLLTFLVLTPLTAQSDYVGLTYEKLTVTATAVAISSATLTRTVVYCKGRVETADLRLRVDGTAPTSAEGVLYRSGDMVRIDGIRALKNARFIRTTSTSAVLALQCYGLPE